MLLSPGCLLTAPRSLPAESEKPVLVHMVAGLPHAFSQPASRDSLARSVKEALSLGQQSLLLVLLKEGSCGPRSQSPDCATSPTVLSSRTCLVLVEPS